MPDRAPPDGGRGGSASPQPPRKAIVLAAGYGTRMLPLTRIVPKPLLPLHGTPMLEHTLRTLQRWGVREVLVNCHHHAAAIAEFAASGSVPGLRMDLSYEPQILGTGGVLRRAAWFLDRDPVWMINADVAQSVDPGPFLAVPPRGRRLAALWLHPGRGPRTVEVRRGIVRSFRSDRPGTPGTCTFCGLHLVSPAILRYIPEGFSSIISAYERAMADGYRIRGVTVDGSWWADVGTPDQYLDAHAEVVQRHREGRAGGEWYDPDATGYRETRSVVLPGASVGRRARLRDAIVGPGVRLDRPASGMLVPAPCALDPHEEPVVAPALGGLSGAVAQGFTRSGSARSFVRVFRGSRSVLLVRDAGTRPENRLYAGHARFLDRCGIRVPRVLADRPARRFTLFEDVGDEDLAGTVARSSRRSVEALYRDLLDTVMRLHTTATTRARRARRTLMPPFTPAMYRWEHRLFIDQFLSGNGRTTPAQADAVRRELDRLARRLHGLPPVLLHRDLQSSNVHRFRGELVLLDFQGMRFGPAVYDLASLLCDPYVCLPEPLQLRLLAHYDPGLAAQPRLFWTAAVQRLVQALGAYGRLAQLPGGAGFAAHVPPALRMLARALHRIERPPDALAAIVDRLTPRPEGR